MLFFNTRKARLLGMAGLLLMCALYSSSARAATDLSILVTSNLLGKSTLDIDHQETKDPLLVLGQNIVYQQKHGSDLYLDLGNALYPGVLSKYSSGSVMMDFLDDFRCQAMLVSSEDLQIGTKNLEFLQKNRKVRLLSSNIVEEGKPVFTPWFEVDMGGVRIAILGISSDKIRFDIAEKELYGFSLIRGKDNLAPYLKAIKAAGIHHIILLSGLALKDTAAILDAFPEIEMALCGGDYSGRYFGGNASRLDLADGRPIVIANDSGDYFLLKLSIDDTLKLRSWEPKKAHPIPTTDYAYNEFKNSLTLWKEKFLVEEVRFVTSLSTTQYKVNDLRFTQLLRDRFNCELGIVEAGTINPSPVSRNVKRADLLRMVNRDYDVFVFTLTGDEIKTLHDASDDLVVAGWQQTDQGVTIQGYPLTGNRRYHVAATQPALEQIKRILGKEIAYHNTWLTVTDLLREDLKGERVVLRKDYDYLDRRFRTTIDAYLANFVDNSDVRKGDSIDTPPGQPSQSYNKWGLENKIDLTVYNKYHRFIFTPYMLYSRQDKAYLNNILRGTLLYDYNIGATIRPYGKLLCDTVVEAVDDQRPILFRATLGGSWEKAHFNAKLGFGFEKEVQDPARAALYGIELILGAKIPFLSHFTYTFDLDSFGGIRREGGTQRQLRSEIDNAVAVAINSHLSLSFGHKLFYVYDDLSGESYRNSEFITSLNLTNDWKFW
jgi:2',3'-cyclic-nucleotide 2'-phosphodiesterase (5'-nucleotidase family)